MREIKFRVWDGACNGFYLPNVADDQNSIRIFLAGNMSYRGTFLGKECILEQFTGLKDRLGQDIYEGDIIKGYGCREDDYQETIGQILFKGDGFCLCGKDRNGLVWFDDGEHETCGLECWRFGGDDEEKEWEVIGNIHQNPEILN